MFYRVLFCLFISGNLFSQDFHGFVIDKKKSKPVPDCLVILKGTTISTITNSKGEFIFPDLPVSGQSIVLNLIGYTTIEHKLSGSKDTFYLAQKNISLKEIEIHTSQKNILNENNRAPLLDFDLLHDNIILLSAGGDHNYLRLIDEHGENISLIKVDKYAKLLKRDCLNNVQLFNNDSAWQVFYDYVKINLMNACTKQTYSRILGNCVCFCDNNYYFKNMEYRNLRANYFYYNEFEKGRKHPLVKFEDTAKIRTFELDYSLSYFLEMRRKYGWYSEPVDSIILKMENYRNELPLDWTYLKWLGNISTEMIKTDSNLFIVNFTDTIIYRVDPDKKVIYNSKLKCFHYKGLQQNIYLDLDHNETYLISFSENKLMVIKFNIQTGEEISKTEIANVPYLPKKLIINRGKIYYVQKNLVDEQAYKLIKYYLN